MFVTVGSLDHSLNGEGCVDRPGVRLVNVVAIGALAIPAGDDLRQLKVSQEIDQAVCDAVSLPPVAVDAELSESLLVFGG